MREMPLILEYIMRQWQHVVWELLGVLNLLIIPRRQGKSDLMAFIAAFLLYFTELPIQIIVAAPTRIKARDLLFHRVKELLESSQSSHIKFLKSELIILNEKTGARIMFFACSAEHGSSARGHLANVLLCDEADEIDHREWVESFLPTQQGLPPETAHIKMQIISGTPRGSSSLLTSLYAKFKPLAPDFKLDTNISFAGKTSDTPIPQEAYDLAQTSDYRVFHLNIDDTDVVKHEELASDRIIMGEEQFRREYYCDLEASNDDVIFKIGDLLKTTQDHHPNINLSPDKNGHINAPETELLRYRPPVAGLDVGRSHDASQLYIRQSLVPLYLGKIEFVEGPENMQNQISQIDRVLQQYGCERIAVDSAGLGQFFVDELERRLAPQGVEVIGVNGAASPLYHWQDEYQNLRSNLYGLLSHAVRHGCPLPDLPELREELSAHTRKDLPHDKRLALCPKKEVKARINRSPDLSDAVAYSFYWDGMQDMESFQISLSSVMHGKVTDTSGLTPREILDQFPELYDEGTSVIDEVVVSFDDDHENYLNNLMNGGCDYEY